MIYFTSDTHFSHDKDFVYSPRGFNSLEEEEIALISNWNNVVSNEDDIYVLGDFFLGSGTDHINKILDQLNGKIHLIIGNHDSPVKLKFYESCDKIIEIVWATQIRYKKRYFYLSHYPTITSNYSNDSDNSHRVIYNLFGHTHSKDKFYDNNPYMYNVAVDAHNNYPISIDDIIIDIQNFLNNGGDSNES